jgi:hypothetical protein
MSGRAIYDPTSGRCLWSAGSVSPGRALYNGLPAMPTTIYMQMGIPWGTWWALGWDAGISKYASGGLLYPGDVWHCRMAGSAWVLHYELNSGGYMVAGADWTNDVAGSDPWDVFGYYTLASTWPTGHEYEYQRVRIVSTILQLSATAYSNVLPDGGTITFTLRLTAAGAKRVTVNGITYPTGFSGANWSGVLAPGEYHDVTVSATVAAYPPLVSNYGNITVATNIGPFYKFVALANHAGGCD